MNIDSNEIRSVSSDFILIDTLSLTYVAISWHITLGYNNLCNIDLFFFLADGSFCIAKLCSQMFA